MRRTYGRPPETLDVYELLQRGDRHVYRGTPEDEAEAWRCIEAATATDPTYAAAIAGLAYLKYREAHANFLDNFSQRMEDCRATAEQALQLDPQNPRALRFLPARIPRSKSRRGASINHPRGRAMSELRPRSFRPSIRSGLYWEFLRCKTGRR